MVISRTTKYMYSFIYLEYHSVCPLVRIGIFQPPLPKASVSPTPKPKRGGTHSIVCGTGGAGSQFGRLEKEPSTLSALCPGVKRCKWKDNWKTGMTRHILYICNHGFDNVQRDKTERQAIERETVIYCEKYAIDTLRDQKMLCHEIFCFSFLPGSSSPKPLKITLGSFRIFSKICGHILKSRCSTINDTGSKFATSVNWFLKKTWSRKSRGTVPSISLYLTVCRIRCIPGVLLTLEPHLTVSCVVLRNLARQSRQSEQPEDKF